MVVLLHLRHCVPRHDAEELFEVSLQGLDNVNVYAWVGNRFISWMPGCTFIISCFGSSCLISRRGTSLDKYSWSR